MLQNVSVVGLGKLGLCLAAVLADAGFHTIGVDINEATVDAINRGESPIVEPGLSDLVARHGGKSLVATGRHSDAVEASDVTFILVATPSYADGRFSNEYAEAALRGLAEALSKSRKPFHTFVVSCTVMPGSTENIFVPIIEKHSGRKLNQGFGICYDPEFVALGTVIRNFRQPDVIVIGESARSAGDRVEQIHHKVCQNDPHVFRMSVISAELAKVSLNVYLTMKISFGNMLANLCEKIPGADVDQIANAIGGDKRISPHYLRGGLAFGGPCFPRDTRAFLALAKGCQYKASLINATDAINEQQARMLLERVLAATKDNSGDRIGVLGLAFKSHTPVITESPAIRLIRELVDRGYPVVSYDPLAIPYAKAIFGEKIEYAKSATDCVSASSVCVIANQDHEYKLAAESCQPGERKTLIDCWRILSPERLPDSVSCIALGRAVGNSSVCPTPMVRANILGVGVSAITMETALRQIERWIDDREQKYVVAAPVHGLMDCQRDEKLREIYNRAGMVIADGWPVAWICRRMGFKTTDHIYGPELMERFCERSVPRGYKHFLYGGWPPNVVERLATRLRERFPGIRIAGTYAPPFRPLRPEEDAEIIEEINSTNPDIVWVGLGTSKEKYWAASHMEKLTAPVVVGVGAAFDFHAGIKHGPPRWVREIGLAWAFRLVHEPLRLGPRYLRDNPAFVYQIMRQLLGSAIREI